MEIRRDPLGRRYATFRRAPLGAGGVACATTREIPSDPERAHLPEPSFLTELGIDGSMAVHASQVHGARILASVTPGAQGEGDALVTDRENLVLTIRTADCVPVFLVAPDRRAVGLVHAGWRGAVAGIVADAVAALVTLYGARVERMWAGVGPAIGPGGYEVGREVAERFDPAHVSERDGRIRLDLPGAVATSLLSAGVGTVELSGLHTDARNDLFPSYRLETTSERLVSLLAWQSSTTRS